MAVPNYYAILSVPKTASFDEIKTAYKKESLRCHPDRLPPTATEAERARSTARFQVVADAYYTLSDPVRRREYDLHAASNSSFPSSFPDDPDAEPSFSSAPPPSASSTSSFFSNLFGAATGAGGADGHADAEATFTSVFADLLEPEVGREQHGKVWSLVGGAGGAACGFIVGNLPGAVAGAFAGNRLGAIRDAKGKAVGEVFMSLGSDRKAEILRALAAKVFATLGANAMGGGAAAPVLEAVDYPRKVTGQLWGDAAREASTNAARYERRPPRGRPSSSTAALRTAIATSESESDDLAPPRTPRAVPRDIHSLKSPSTTPSARGLGAFPLLFEYLRAELAQLEARQAAHQRPPVSFSLPGAATGAGSSSDDGASDAGDPRSTAKRGRTRPTRRQKPLAHNVLATLPSFADLLTPRRPAAPPAKDKTLSLAQGTLLQLRAVEDKLARLFPADVDGVAAAVDLERKHLEHGVPKTLVDELQDQRLAAQSAMSTAAAAAASAPGSVHVFVDHSNILVGLTSQTDLLSDKTYALPSGVRQRLSHLALALVLARGRRALTLALVGSSPLWQPLDDLEVRGWDVCLLQRVRAALDVGPSGKGGSSGGSSADETEGGRAGRRQHRREKGSMKEQSVDELLQLKILLAISLYPPATLVLATGDSAGSHLNPLGFAGIAELALRRGWDVEVCAWGASVGRAWRELEKRWTGGQGAGKKGKGAAGGRLSIRPLDPFREELEAL